MASGPCGTVLPPQPGSSWARCKALQGARAGGSGIRRGGPHFSAISSATLRSMSLRLSCASAPAMSSRVSAAVPTTLTPRLRTNAPSSPPPALALPARRCTRSAFTHRRRADRGYVRAARARAGARSAAVWPCRPGKALCLSCLCPTLGAACNCMARP